MKKNVVVGALAALVLTAWLLATTLLPNRNAELGRFTDVSKAEIESTALEVCRALGAAGCGPLRWSGKHKWFGSIEWLPQGSPASAAALASVLIAQGWAAHPEATATELKFERGNVRCSLMQANGKVARLVFTTVAQP